MPTLVWRVRRRPEQAAVRPDPVSSASVSAAAVADTVPYAKQPDRTLTGAVVLSPQGLPLSYARWLSQYGVPPVAAAHASVREDAAIAAASSSQRNADCGRRKQKRKANFLVAAAAKKARVATWSNRRGLPKGVYKTIYGKYRAQMYWRGKNRTIGTFDSVEQASAACMSLRKDLGDAQMRFPSHVVANDDYRGRKDLAGAILTGPDADEAGALFDAAMKKARGGSLADWQKTIKSAAFITAMAEGKNKASVAQLDASIPRGVTIRDSGRWQAQIYVAGKSRYIGVFDTRETAALAYEVARTELQKAKAFKNIAPEEIFSKAKKAAFAAIESTVSVESTNKELWQK